MQMLGVQEILFIIISFTMIIVSIFLINKYLIESWFKKLIQLFLYLSLSFLVIVIIIGIKNIINAKYNI